MHSSMSSRLKIVLVSGLCLLAMISLTTGMNLCQNSTSNRLTGSESRKMLTISAQAQLRGFRIGTVSHADDSLSQES